MMNDDEWSKKGYLECNKRWCPWAIIPTKGPPSPDSSKEKQWNDEVNEKRLWEWENEKGN